MQDQHKKIKGYRDLTQEEVDLMNEIKGHGQVTKNLIAKVRKMRKVNEENDTYGNPPTHLTQSQLDRSATCLDNAEVTLQTGMMWFVRSVALPEGF